MQYQLFFGMALVLMYVVYRTNVPAILGWTWALFLAHGLFLAYSPWWFANYSPNVSNVISWSACKAMLQLLVIPLTVLAYVDAKERDGIFGFVALFMAVEAMLLMMGFRGMLLANTFGAGVIACLSPLLWRKSLFPEGIRNILLCLVVGAVLVTKSRTGMLAFATIGITYLWYYVRERHKELTKYFYLTAVSLTVLFTWLYFPTLIRDPRFLMWASYFDWIVAAKIDLLKGTGFGSFEWLGLTLDSGWNGIRFYVMHNDWLQILFEAGIPGLIMAVLSYLFVLKNLLHSKEYTAIWLAIGTTMFFYYQSHALIVQIVGMLLIKEAIQEYKCREYISTLKSQKS